VCESRCRQDPYQRRASCHQQLSRSRFTRCKSPPAPASPPERYRRLGSTNQECSDAVGHRCLALIGAAICDAVRLPQPLTFRALWSRLATLPQRNEPGALGGAGRRRGPDDRFRSKGGGWEATNGSIETPPFADRSSGRRRCRRSCRRASRASDTVVSGARSARDRSVAPAAWPTGSWNESSSPTAARMHPLESQVTASLSW
jgi:hypothetical protein